MMILEKQKKAITDAATKAVARVNKINSYLDREQKEQGEIMHRPKQYRQSFDFKGKKLE